MRRPLPRRSLVLALAASLLCCHPKGCREPPPPDAELDDLQPVRDPLPSWELAPHPVLFLSLDGGALDAGPLDAGLDGGAPDAGHPDAGPGVAPAAHAARREGDDFEDDEDEDGGLDAGHGCGTDGGLVTCTADCWCSAPSFDASGALLAVGVTASGDAWALGSTFLHYDGHDWEEVATGRRLFGTESDAFAGTRRPRMQGSAVWAASSDDVWMARGSRFSHWDGRQFSSGGSSMALPNTVSALWGSGPNDLWAVGQGGTLAHGDGSSWSTTASGTTESLTGVWGTRPHDVWMVGTNGTFLHSDGTNVEPLESGTTAWLTGIWVSPSGELWVAGNGGVWRGGKNGLHALPVGDVALASIWGDGAGRVWAVGTVGTIFRFEHGGWRTEASGTRANLRAVRGGGGRVYVVGDSGVLLWHQD